MPDILTKVRAILNIEENKDYTKDYTKDYIQNYTYEDSKVYVIFYDTDKFALRCTESEFIFFSKEHIIESYGRYDVHEIYDVISDYIANDNKDIYDELKEHCIDGIMDSETLRLITNDVEELNKALDSFEHLDIIKSVANKLKLKLYKEQVDKGEVSHDI